ncbi:SPASM domain-containing protein, partial [Thermodesulfobacteriota bacterium]
PPSGGRPDASRSAGGVLTLHSWDNILHDKITNSTGAAIETKRGIINAVEAGFCVTVNQVINKQNIHTMYESADNLEKLGVSAVAMTRFVPPLDCSNNVESVGAEEFIDELLKCKSNLDIPCNSLLPFCFCSDDRVEAESLGLNCSCGIYSAAVSSKGDMRMCVHDSEVWGNILNEDLELVWSRISEWRTEISVPNDCMNCVYLPDCMGGCRVDSKYHTGTYKGMDSWAKRPKKDLVRKTIYYKMHYDTPHFLSPNLRYRTEGNGYLVFGNSKSIIVNQDGLELINRLPKKFVPREIIKRGGENANLIKTFLEDLHKKMFIIKI